MRHSNCMGYLWAVHSSFMEPIIVDKNTGTELWTASQCAEYSGTARGTFTSYAGRGRAPRPVAKYNGLTLWNSNVVKEWQQKRDGAPTSSDTTAQK